MTFRDATEYLQGLINYEKTPATTAMERYLNLDRMREALARVGDPQRGLRIAHVAGTKGKGSTCVMLASILRAAGRRVGLFTKPHLITLRERMRIDDDLISEEAFAAQVAAARPVVEAMQDSPYGPPTYFEVLTLIALRWFAEEGVDVVVLETGMGGRLDSTNVVQPLVTGITTIALDHVVELGETVALIAAEKAGIIKPGVPVVSAPQVPEAEAVIARVAAEQGAPLYRVGEEITLQPSFFHSPTGQRFSVTGRHGTYADLTCPLLGEHQQLNAAVAIGMAEVLQDCGEPVDARAIRTGIATVKWPGRLQVLRAHPLLILDGAHDPAAVTVLLAALERHFPGHPLRFVLGFAQEKDWQQMLHQFAAVAHDLLLTAAETPRAVPPETLAAAAAPLGVPIATAPDVPAAVQQALATAGVGDLICVTGSLYVVGDALRWWGERA